MKNNSSFSESSLMYEKSLDEDYKKNNGIFYTDVELANAIIEFWFSSIDGIMDVTVSTESNVVINSHEASAETAPVPSLSFDIPTPTPITNKSAMLLINADPAFTKKKPNKFQKPDISPPCIVAGHSA